MAAENSRRLFNVHEYHRMVDAGILSEDDRVELIRGEILIMSPVGRRTREPFFGRATDCFRSSAIAQSLAFPARLVLMTGLNRNPTRSYFVQEPTSTPKRTLVHRRYS